MYYFTIIEFHIIIDYCKIFELRELRQKVIHEIKVKINVCATMYAPITLPEAHILLPQVHCC